MSRVPALKELSRASLLTVKADFMTADWFTFDSDFLNKVSTRITNEVRGVSRVLYDSEQHFEVELLAANLLTNSSYKQTARYD